MYSTESLNWFIQNLFWDITVYNSLYELATESFIQPIHSTMIWSGVKEVI